jgi:hypothetical protein
MCFKAPTMSSIIKCYFFEQNLVIKDFTVKKIIKPSLPSAISLQNPIADMIHSVLSI